MPRIRTFYHRYQPEIRLLMRVLVITAVLVSIRAAAAYAGNDITFDELNGLIENWTKGSLGKALALIALILGIGVAAARQSFGALFGGGRCCRQHRPRRHRSGDQRTLLGHVVARMHRVRGTSGGP